MNVAIIGANGAIGSAFIELLAARSDVTHIHAFSRHLKQESTPKVNFYALDLTDEHAMAQAAAKSTVNGPLDIVIVATGILHTDDIKPEKSLRDLSAAKFQHIYTVNTIIPSLLAKHFLPRLHKDKRAVFAALSARVGSISDNYLGGWYAYRASKAALNMMIRNASIEMARRSKEMIVVGLHPGTVDSALSQPFQDRVAEGHLFSPAYSVAQMMTVIDGLRPADSGKCFAYDGEIIAP